MKEYLSRFPANLIWDLAYCPQDPIYHKEGSVYNHMLLVLKEIENINLPEKTYEYNHLLAAGLFHDLGKLDTTTYEMKDGITRIHHFKHEFASLKYIDKYKDLFYDIEVDWNIVRELVREHMRVKTYLSGKMKNELKRTKMEQLKSFDLLCIFSSCDDKGRL